jgi:hypothetical protein
MTDNIDLTSEERRLARHALGLSAPCATGVAYRNRYLAGAQSDAAEIWRGLAKRGLAMLGEQWSGSIWAHCGSQLANAVLESGETIDREETESLAAIDKAIAQKPEDAANG